MSESDRKNNLVTTNKKRSREEATTKTKQGPKRQKPSPVSLKDEYGQLTDREHVYKRPDTYYGSVFPETSRVWTRPSESLICNKDRGKSEQKEDGKKDATQVGSSLLAFAKMVYRSVTYVPAFFKMFDEVLVNALDNFTRTRSGYRHPTWDKDEPIPKMTELRVDIDRQKGRIRIWNNGKTIRVCKQTWRSSAQGQDRTSDKSDKRSENAGKSRQVYAPSLVFGELRTSNNFDDEEERITGGRNGYGAKLANIGSIKFIVRIQDKYHKLSFHQVWRNNMAECDEPIIETSASDPDSTEVTFYPDFKWLHMPNGLDDDDDDIVSLLEKRVWDAAATCDGLQVTLNGIRLPKFSFAEYPGMFVPDHWECVTKRLPSRSAASLTPMERERLTEIERLSEQAKAKKRGLGTVKYKKKSGHKSSEDHMEDVDGGAGNEDKQENDEMEDDEEEEQDWRDKVKVLRDTDEKQRFELVLVPNPMDETELREEQQASYVNNIWTMRGGTHIQQVMEPLIAALREEVMKQKRMKDVKLPPKFESFVNKHWFVFLRTTLINPAFDTQSKVRLVSQFSPSDHAADTKKDTRKGKSTTGGASENEAPKLEPLCLSPTFVKKVLKSGFVHMIVEHCLRRHMIKNLQKSDGSKQMRKKPKKLEDADKAGTKESDKCSLFLTEGDSAKSLVMAGFKEIGRTFYGVFPLRGKFINVREVKISRLEKNLEFYALKQILGLKNELKYETAEERQQLRYGKLILFTDRDHDGSHIAGLIINLFATFWPALLDDYIQLMLSPVVRITRGKQKRYFYQYDAYRRWYEDNDHGKGWHVKYYKGLGTSTSVEAQEYFSHLDDLLVQFNIRDMTQDMHYLEIAFNKKRAKARKEMVTQYDPDKCAPLKYGEGLKNLSFAKWVMRDYIHYMNAANERSIPHLMDGLKPVHRKVLYALFQRKSNPEQKVPSLGGYITEKAAYHHGEQSLYATMIKMAQNFVGSNNLNWLVPSGQFGSRPEMGKDAAAARYLNTKLTDLTRLIFLPRDDTICMNQFEDGQKIQPECFYPILPTVLVNGVNGMGCGWSTSIPAFNPIDLLSNLKRLLNGDDPSTLPMIHPYYRGYRGSILRKHGSDSTYIIQGIVGFVDPNDHKTWKKSLKSEDAPIQLVVTEVPFSVSKDKYETQLDKLKASGDIVRWKSQCIDENLMFHVTLTRAQLMKAEKMGGDDLDTGLLTYLSLVDYLYVNGIVCYDLQHRIQRYQNPNHVLTEFFKVRLNIYEKVRQSQIQMLEQASMRLRNLIRFKKCLQSREITLQDQSDTHILKTLTRLKFDLVQSTSTSEPSKPADDDDDNDGSKDSKQEETEETETEEKEESDVKSAGADDKKGGATKEDEDLSEELKVVKAGYQYLLSRNLWSLGRKKTAKEEGDLSACNRQLESLRKTSNIEMWKQDLAQLEPALERHNKKWLADRSIPKSKKRATSTTNKTTKMTKWRQSGKTNKTGSK